MIEVVESSIFGRIDLADLQVYLYEIHRLIECSGDQDLIDQLHAIPWPPKRERADADPS